MPESHDGATFAFGGRGLRVVDLSQALTNDTAAFEPMPHRVEYVDYGASVAGIEARWGIGPEFWPGGQAWAFERVTLTTHSGTHVDASYHYHPVPGAKTIEQVPLRWPMSDGVVLDLRHCGRESGITALDVQDALGTIDYRLKPYDIVLIRTDTSLHYRDEGYDLVHPGLRRDATAWLVEHGARLIGIDAWGIDRALDVMVEEARAGDRAQLWESHKFGAEREYCQIEKLCNLDVLPPHGFQVIALPISIEGASGGWARVVALVPEP